LCLFVKLSGYIFLFLLVRGFLLRDDGLEYRAPGAGVAFAVFVAEAEVDSFSTVFFGYRGEAEVLVDEGAEQLFGGSARALRTT
jgi:hypothetical protein